MKDLILLENNFAFLNDSKSANDETSRIHVGTLIANLAYYGYCPSKDMLNQMMVVGDLSLANWWSAFEPVIKSVTGDDRPMAEFVVYKNFPDEVLNMSQSEYWFNQTLMYLGMPNEYFTEDEKEREPLNEDLSLKVIHLGNDNSLENIFYSLLKLPARWTDNQWKKVQYCVFEEKIPFETSMIPFKENLLILVNEVIKKNVKIYLKSATDVLRLAIAMSDGDVSLRTNTKFRRFKRSERRMLLSMLESSSNLAEDVNRHREVWKRFLRELHAGDYKNRFPAVIKIQNTLYKKEKIVTFNVLLERYINSKDSRALDLVAKRPGEFVRRLRKLVSLFGKDAVNGFIGVIPRLSTIQLLKVKKYLEFINLREFRLFPPRGNWGRVQVVKNEIMIKQEHIDSLLGKINVEISSRINKKFPQGIWVDDSADWVKLKDNDSDLTDYGRGTVFPIPENVTFVRTASYWEHPSVTNVWYDNGWNFFDNEWGVMGSCCWDQTSFLGSVFSGDPTNSKNLKGRACQMIDLDLEILKKRGVRYAVWNILCFSHEPFDNANEVLATLQWGEEPMKGKLFEPSRCQLSFPVTGTGLTKYIAYLDLVKNVVVYLDVGFSGNVSSAATNGTTLSEKMPAYLEYLDTLPSIKDLFCNTKESNSTDRAVVTYSDGGINLNGQDAYVFRPVNQNNSFNSIEINQLL